MTLTTTITESERLERSIKVVGKTKSDKKPPREEEEEWSAMDNIVWSRAFWLGGIHVAGLFGFYMAIFYAQSRTNLWNVFLHILSMTGLTTGYHRMWSHRAFKARWPFRLFLALCGVIPYQQSVWRWARDHRLHHKFSETDKDPHNPKRSTFYAHIGCIMSKKHPQVIETAKKFDLIDLRNDWVVQFQDKHYSKLVTIFCILIPTIVPWYFWNESLTVSYFVCVPLRIIFSLHSILALNSWGHLFGDHRKVDKHIGPNDSILLSFVTLGEGNHNFHHVFPWDWAGDVEISPLNWSSLVIRLGILTGQVYHLRRATPEMIQLRRDKNLL